MIVLVNNQDQVIHHYWGQCLQPFFHLISVLLIILCTCQSRASCATYSNSTKCEVDSLLSLDQNLPCLSLNRGSQIENLTHLSLLNLQAWLQELLSAALSSGYGKFPTHVHWQAWIQFQSSLLLHFQNFPTYRRWMKWNLAPHLSAMLAIWHLAWDHLWDMKHTHFEWSVLFYLDLLLSEWLEQKCWKCQPTIQEFYRVALPSVEMFPWQLTEPQEYAIVQHRLHLSDALSMQDICIIMCWMNTVLPQFCENWMDRMF